ncbi:MAG: hypothetical protein JWO51_1083 [Rhodospirillales bacterium]|nr:hypothetical protein [Rhodospirillales bacterium]
MIVTDPIGRRRHSSLERRQAIALMLLGGLFLTGVYAIGKWVLS